MKVGILTFHKALHVGAFLQAYSLYHILKTHFDTIIVNYLPKLYYISSPTISTKRLIVKHQWVYKHGFTKRITSACGEFLNYISLFGIERRKEIVYENNLHKLSLSKPITNLDELRKVIEEFHIIVVGSDQVWNPEYLLYSDYAYLLPFKLGKTRKVAYAASLGIDDFKNIPSHVLDIYRKCLRDFDFISLRERSHVSFLSTLINKEIYHAVDPTLLINKEWWEAKARCVKGVTGLNVRTCEYVFIYNLNYDMLLKLEPLIDKLAHEGVGIIAYALPRPFPLCKSLNSLKHFIRLVKKVKFVEYIDPFEFLWLVKNAKYVITNSYHGTIFSIIFEKPFVTIPFRVNATRMLDLLELLSLTNRIAYTNNEIMHKLNDNIDFNTVKTLLDFHRQCSLKLLINALNTL
jgi:hypothetical protein